MKKSVLAALKNMALVVGGTLILSFATAVFVIPFDLVVGGISSIAIILHKVISVEVITVDVLITVVTWLLFFVGLFCLGRQFAIKTLLSTIVYPIGFSLFSKLLDPGVLDGIFCLDQSRYSHIAVLLAALFGGILIGMGCALTFLGGGSTGGVDIFAFILCKFFKKLRSSVVIFVIDAVTILLGLLVVKDLVITLLGITAAFVGALVVDKIFLGKSRAFMAQIVTDHYQEVNRLVAERLERTTSILDIEGGYSGEKKKMLMVTFTLSQYNELLAIVSQTDPTAFVTVHPAHQINGEGWTW